MKALMDDKRMACEIAEKELQEAKQALDLAVQSNRNAEKMYLEVCTKANEELVNSLKRFTKKTVY